MSPYAADAQNGLAPQKRARKSWAPGEKEHRIFDWVKMKGQTQEEVAGQLGISQATVSRIVQRYEKWQARSSDREAGRLVHAERLRAQRQLTYERNELFLATCVRMASDMEQRSLHSAKTTVLHGTASAPEQTVRTQHQDIDLRGMAARFLRLGFRINMEQYKLVSLDALPDLPPLADDELEEQLEAAAALEEELEHARQKTIAQFDEQHRLDMDLEREIEQVYQTHAADLARQAEVAAVVRGSPDPAVVRGSPDPAHASDRTSPAVPGDLRSVEVSRSGDATEGDSAAQVEESLVASAVGGCADHRHPDSQPDSRVNNLHNVHEEDAGQNGASVSGNGSYGTCGDAEKKSRDVHNGAGARSQGSGARSQEASDPKHSSQSAPVAFRLDACVAAPQPPLALMATAPP